MAETSTHIAEASLVVGMAILQRKLEVLYYSATAMERFIRTLKRGCKGGWPERWSVPCGMKEINEINEKKYTATCARCSILSRTELKYN